MTSCLVAQNKEKFKNQIFTHIPLDIHLVIKHMNRGKIESHLWYFKGFCCEIPEFCFIIDAGTVAHHNSISKIIFEMEADETIGGACGEIEVLLADKNEDGSSISFVQSILLRSQYLEYKVSHYLDKAAESLFGFVSVLPGAFSAFRYKAVEGEPLRQFLKGHKITDSKLKDDEYPSLFESNKFLAEDRIMCLEILTKKDCNYILKFIPGAKALTDPPMSLMQLLKQRRRWYNGTIVSTCYVLLNCGQLWRRNWTHCCRENNSFCRNIFLMFLYFYMFLNLVVSTFLIGIFYATYSIFVRYTYDYDEGYSITHTANNLENAYLILMGIVLILSVSVKIQYIETMFRYVSFLFGIISIVMITTLPQLNDFSVYNLITL